jgi:hypothetical protein
MTEEIVDIDEATRLELINKLKNRPGKIIVAYVMDDEAENQVPNRLTFNMAPAEAEETLLKAAGMLILRRHLSGDADPN